MNQLKYILVAALGMAAVAASAQPPPGAPGGPPHGGPGFGGSGFGGPPDIDRLAILLDLDPYQKNQVQAALTAQHEAMKAARQQRKAAGDSGQRPTFEEMRAKRQANEDALVGQLSTVLSDTQITKLKVLMEPPHGGRGPRHGPPGSTSSAAPSDVPTK